MEGFYGDENDGWDNPDQEDWEIEDQSEPSLIKQQSSFKDFRFVQYEEMVPAINKKCAELNDLLGLTNDDCITILRYYGWNTSSVQENWFDGQETLEIELGLEFDKSRFEQCKEGIPEHNGGLCPMCYCEYEDPIGLKCGHQVCRVCYEDYL